MKLEDKVALVTGATSYIGRAIARGYAAEGASVFLQDFPDCADQLVLVKDEMTAAALDVGSKRQVASGTYDITQRRDVAAMTQTIIELLGRVDVMVNTQSRAARGPIFELSEAEFDDAIDVGVKSYFLTGQYVGKEMARRGRGKIIHLTSIAGRLGSGGSIPWSATCGARDALMRAMAHALGVYGIQVNGLGHARQEESGASDIERAERLRRIPLGRLGTADDMVGPAIFLASSDSDYITGEVLYVDGGYTTASVTDDEHRPKQIPYVGD
jgi:NAD(P)-dependent dehydrogenase (short-subunit alcohol dehydrogenase family)